MVGLSIGAWGAQAWAESQTVTGEVVSLHLPRSGGDDRHWEVTEVEPRFVPMLLRDVSEQADVLADSFQDSLNDPGRSVRPADGPQDARRVGLAIFIVDEPATVEAAASGRKSRTQRSD